MDRKKPSLTSPWKVGLLVALLMVVTALGVSYFITGNFNVTWHWIQIGGLSPKTWTFHLGAFVEEMGPLLLLTALLACASYVLVAGAVRRYKAYVDSGVEYKQLLKSIKGVDDLDDAALVDKLKQHPELRDFLLGVKHRMAALERQQSERKPGAAPSPARKEDPGQLAVESATLADAIRAGRENFPQEIPLTLPELKQIERAVRAWVASAPLAPPVDAGAGAHEAMVASVRATLTALRADVNACGSGAREVETALGALRAQLAGGARQPAGDTATIQKRVDAVAGALVTLGEESKRVAIAAALQASGGPAADNIKIAEELRTIATRFNAVAQHWRETAPALKSALDAGASGVRPDGMAAAVATVANRARLWGERAVALNEHVRALEHAVGGDTAASTHAAVDFEEIDVAPVAPAPPAGPAPRAGEPQPAPLGEVADKLTAQPVEMFGSDNGDDAGFVDIPGFEKEKKFFADSAAANETTDDQFVVDNGQDHRWDLSEERAEPAPAPVTPSRPAGADADGFLTGPRPTVSPKRVERPAPQPAPAEAAPRPAMEPATATATLDRDADAVDLYALGAIDCVQTM